MPRFASGRISLDELDSGFVPPSGQLAVYAKDGRLHTQDSDETETAYASVTDILVPPPLTYTIEGDLETVEGTYPIYNDSGKTWRIIAVRATCVSAPDGADVVVDVKKNGTTIFGSGGLPTVPDGQLTGKSTAMTVTEVADGDYLTVDVIQVGSSEPGTGLIVQITFG